jgi:hypothetical protein
MCMTNDYTHIPQKELVQGCALEHGIDFDKLNDCASKDDGAYGLDMLRESFKRTADAKVTFSCTVCNSFNVLLLDSHYFPGSTQRRRPLYS